MDTAALAIEYDGLRAVAPQRALRCKSYFVGHTGSTPGDDTSNRREEHLARALCDRGSRWPWPGGGWFQPLDYQVPLKARRDDLGVGKIDLLGVTDIGRLVVVELKVDGADNSRGDSPPAALMQALRYAAILQANQSVIAAEAKAKFNAHVSDEAAPAIMLLGTESWWQSWLRLKAAGAWTAPFVRLLNQIEMQVGITVRAVAITQGKSELPIEQRLVPVDLVAAPPPSSEMDPQIDLLGRTHYLAELNTVLWQWADRYLADKLDGGGRHNRPPVLRAPFAECNVLTPAEPESIVSAIHRAIAPKQRHRHFASLRSSQALAQSVFGALRAVHRLDLLAGLSAECGRPAFFDAADGWSLTFEHEVRSLNEPRPTSIDVFLQGPRRVAIECKFTEGDFGTCSRPRLKPTDNAYAQQFCDGTYRAQHGRKERCALTSIGVIYWRHLPALFDWPADEDHLPCPLSATYQLARNALAAVVDEDGSLQPDKGHALILYDARNPAFLATGKAGQQWHAAIGACRVPGLLRRLSWQELLVHLGRSPELGWLMTALKAKYGLVPADRRGRGTTSEVSLPAGARTAKHAADFP